MFEQVFINLNLINSCPNKLQAVGMFQKYQSTKKKGNSEVTTARVLQLCFYFKIGLAGLARKVTRGQVPNKANINFASLVV